MSPPKASDGRPFATAGESRDLLSRNPDCGAALAIYRRHPGHSSYSLPGTPVGDQTHAASYVAAAAAAKAAGQNGEMHQLLDQAQKANSAHPTYYGAAWVALGRVMLTSSALGSCPD